jgi:hypothetical protein
VLTISITRSAAYALHRPLLIEEIDINPCLTDWMRPASLECSCGVAISHAF